MKKYVLVLLCCLISAVMLGSTAFAATGPYLGVQVGGTWLEDADVDYDNPFFIDDEVEFDTGFNVGLAAGYDFGMARLEGEVAYRQNDLDKIEINFAPGDVETFSLDGDVSALSFMLNGYLDIETGSPITPYLGAGLGVANVSANDVKIKDPDFGNVKFVDDDDTVFAYQFSAGIAFALNEALALDLGYRYFATSDPEFDTAIGWGGFESEYKSHNVSLGLRMSF